MRARILFVSDLHKRDCDFSTIAGYTKAVDAVQRDILSFIKQKGITHLVSLGDWYDKGYRSINRSNNDRNLDEDLSKAVNGNFYICLGNHFFLERTITQRCTSYSRLSTTSRVSPFMPHHLLSGRYPLYVLDLFRSPSFTDSKENKNYIAERDPEVKYHIGVYHDDTVVPTQQRNGAGFRGTTMTSYLDNIFENINLAIVGHIHTPVGAFNIQARGKFYL